MGTLSRFSPNDAGIAKLIVAKSKNIHGFAARRYQRKSYVQEDKPKVHNKHAHTAPHDAVYVGRGSPWGNPFKIDANHSRLHVIREFERYILPHLDLKPLRGKHLVCFCAPLPCHADVLLREANK